MAFEVVPIIGVALGALALPQSAPSLRHAVGGGMSLEGLQALIDELFTEYLPSFRPRMLRLLQDICQGRQTLPSSYIIENVVCGHLRAGVGGEAVVYHGMIGDAKVAIRYINLPPPSPLVATISPEVRNRHLARVRREIILHRQLRHRNILPFLGVCPDKYHPLPMVLQLMDCTSIDYLRSNPDQRGSIMVGATRGLEYLHSQDPPILHGDIHPSNILVDEVGTAVLSDFGLSRLKHDETRVGSLLQTGGHPAFLAPEIRPLRSGEIPFRTTTATDTFALGVTFYFFITMDMGLIHATGTASQTPPQLVTSLLSQADTVIMRQLYAQMCFTEPSKRPSTASILGTLRTTEFCADNSSQQPRYSQGHLQNVVKHVESLDVSFRHALRHCLEILVEDSALEQWVKKIVVAPSQAAYLVDVLDWYLLPPAGYRETIDAPNINWAHHHGPKMRQLFYRVCEVSCVLPARCQSEGIILGDETVHSGSSAIINTGKTTAGQPVMVRTYTLDSVAIANRRWRSPKWETASKILRREVAIHLLLNHPNILPLLGVSQDPTRALGIVLPPIGRRAVTYLMSNNNPTVFLDLLLGIAEGVLYLHSQNPSVVHGDLQPDHVLTDEGGQALISSFSCAQTQLSSTKLPCIEHLSLPLYRYSAPEVIANLEDVHPKLVISKPSDVYALGMTFYSLGLRGKEPYHKLAKPHEIAAAVARGERPDEPELFGNLAKPQFVALWSLMTRMWAVDPESRPTMDAVRHEIRSTLV